MKPIDRNDGNPLRPTEDLEARAMEAFGQVAAADRGMSTPQPLLKGMSPRQYGALGKSQENRVLELLAALRFGGPV